MLMNNEVADLTFVTWNDDRRSHWTPERPSDYAAACAMGRDYANEFLVYCYHQSGDVSGLILSRIMGAMVAGGEWGGVEVAFCHAIGERVA